MIMIIIIIITTIITIIIIVQPVQPDGERALGVWGGTQTGSYQTGSSQKGRSIPPKTGNIIFVASLIRPHLYASEDALDAWQRWGPPAFDVEVSHENDDNNDNNHNSNSK